MKHSTIIYIPTPPEECSKRIKNRDRIEECGIPTNYLTALENGNEEMLRHFSGSVFKLDELKNTMSPEDLESYVYSFMQKYSAEVGLVK